MIHVVTNENAAEYKDLLEEMFRWRHQIYVEQRGWKALARPDGREIDQFDNADTVYHIVLDEDDKFAGSMRFNPTHRATLIAEVFSHLVIRGELPRSPSVWDVTRGFVIPSKRRESGKCPALDELFTGMMEWAVAEELDYMVGLGEIHWLPRWLKMGWVVDPLGLPSLIEGEYWVPMRIETGASILAATRQAFQLPDVSVFAHQKSMRLAS
ncbi:MAG: acyl-homoserine-lactone synthase [Alphaproteobacteria bacterium]